MDDGDDIKMTRQGAHGAAHTSTLSLYDTAKMYNEVKLALVVHSKFHQQKFQTEVV